MTASLALTPRARRAVTSDIELISAAMLSTMDGGWTRGHVVGDFDSTRGLFEDDVAWLASGFTSEAPRSTSYPVLIAALQDIAPGSGYAMHPHVNLATVTIVLEGSYLHEDGTGDSSIVGSDDIAVVAAGATPFAHQETVQRGAPLRSAMFWLRARPGTASGFATRTIARGDRTNRLVSIGLPIAADVEVHTGVLTRGSTVEHTCSGDGYLMATRAAIDVNGIRAEPGDRVLLSGSRDIEITAHGTTDVVLLTA